MECKGCKGGIKMCHHRPCMGTPEDFNKIIDAGFANLIQLDYWEDPKGNIDILTMGVHPIEKSSLDGMDEDSIPYLLQTYFGLLNDSDPKAEKFSSEHTGGKRANQDPTGKCVMLDKDNDCLLHDMDLKPEQGKEACCKGEADEAKSNEHYSIIWNTLEGKTVIEKWKDKVNFKD